MVQLSSKASCSLQETNPSIMWVDKQHHSVLHDHEHWLPCPGSHGPHTSVPGADSKFPCWKVSRTVGLRDVSPPEPAC